MASINDKFIKTSVVEPTRLRDPLSSSATTLTVESTAGWNGDTAILAVIDRVDSAGNLTPDKMEIVIGTMNASGLEQLRRGVGGRAQVHSSGAVVELSIAGSEQWNRAMDALISALGQDGKIKESAFTNGLQVVDGSVIKDGSIEPGKIKGGFVGAQYKKFARYDNLSVRGNWAMTAIPGARASFNVVSGGVYKATFHISYLTNGNSNSEMSAKMRIDGVNIADSVDSNVDSNSRTAIGIYEARTTGTVTATVEIHSDSARTVSVYDGVMILERIA